MTLSFDFYFSFRSPYSYLATPAIADLLARYDAAAAMKVVRPIAVRIPGFFKQVNPLWPPYLNRDTWRIAQMNGIPYAWPRPDPIVQDRQTRDVSPDQPYIMRISRMGQAASEAGKGFEFIHAASSVIWGGATENWHQDDHLAKAAESVGLDGARLDAQSVSDAERLDAAIFANESAQTEAGHWGVPLFVFEGEPFFGQDRIDVLIWRMKQRGLAERG